VTRVGTFPYRYRHTSHLPIATTTTTDLHLPRMVYPFLTGSTLLRTQRTVLPRIHLRYKSISAAIERGRNDGPDRPFRSRPRNDGDDNGQLKTRREARFEKFGPPRDEPPPRDERRSSRFGRVPRDNDAPSRSNDGEERKPTSWMGRGSRRVGKEEGGNRAWKEKPKSAWALAGHNTLARDGLPVNKFMREELTGPEERAPRQERVGRDIVEITNEARMTLTKSFDRPRTSFGGDGGGESREFNREDRGGERRSFNRDDRGGERRTFNREDRGGDRRPFNRDDTGGERRSFNRDDRGGERRTFNRDDRGGERRTFNREDGGGERRPFNRDDRGGERRVFNRDDRGERREFNPERSERFPRRDGDAPPSTFRSRDAPEDRPRESRFTQRPDSKGARRERNGRDDTDAPSTTVSTPFVRGPESLPYTTAASEFVYGHSSVLAAIKANRRKFYNLYVHSRGASRDGLMSKIRAHKLFSITQEVGDEYMRALDKASSGRPHNGVILESSPLPVPPITELKTSSVEDESFSIGLDTQTKEDEDVNGKQELYSYRSGGWRHPLILYVDGVVSHVPIPINTQPGNYRGVLEARCQSPQNITVVARLSKMITHPKS
jgi:21S rRNA (GM2251-2'-O)-methyltransferase